MIPEKCTEKMSVLASKPEIYFKDLEEYVSSIDDDRKLFVRMPVQHKPVIVAVRFDADTHLKPLK